MSKFHVGQRVRIIGPAYTAVLGHECRILQLDVLGKEFGRSYVGMAVDIPHELPPGWCVFEAHELAPIQYDGAAPSTWDACLWRPDGSHKKVAEEGRAIALRAPL